MFNQKRFDDALLAWARAYPSLKRDRRAINIVWTFIEGLVLGRIVVELVSARWEFTGIWLILLTAVVGVHFSFNAVLGLARVVRNASTPS
ncbi:MAG TPA: hypothetical protein VEJ63_11830 [Planctomycetota bacterium]|nr:hypothetical protein [Planctomycetota bacterium]